MTTSAERLKAIKELREAASPGPWEVVYWTSGAHRQREYYTVISPTVRIGSGCVASIYIDIDTNPETNARLVAQAPAFAASVEALGAGYENCITVLHAFHEFPEKAIKDCETPSCVEFCKAEATIPVVAKEE